jgi:hypothetical protein
VTGFAILATLFINFELLEVSGYYTKAHLFLVVSMTAVLLVLLIHENRILTTCKLINENQIMRIQLAEIEIENRKKGQDIEAVISCFGILLGSKVIKFNLEGIQLKSVEICKEYICLSYGTKKKNEKIRILYGGFGMEECSQIVEKFRYETGVIPTITGIC